MPKIEPIIRQTIRPSKTRLQSNLLVWPFLLLLVVLFTACTTLGPDFVKPPAPVEDKWIEAENSQIKMGPGDHSAWWQVFNDPVLDNLIEIASEQNLSLRVAGLRIIESRALLGIAVGLRYPQTQLLNGGYSFSRSSKNAPPLSSFPDDINNRVDRNNDVYRIGFDAAWEIDFWGKFRRAVEAAEAGLSASIAGYDNLLVILTGEVAAAYMVIRTLEQRLEFARSNVVIQKRSLDIADVRFKGGATSELDVQQARSLMHNTQALIPVLEINIRQAKHGLSVLLGIPPSDMPGLIASPSTIPEPPMEVAIGIPADLLRRRPDIRLAEFQAAAQGALIGVTKADLYPHFALGGSIGFAAGSGNTLLDSGSITSFFTPFSFRWDIFNYGRIKNKVRAQDARFEQRLVVYQNKVLQAAREVEDALVGFISSQKQAHFLSDAVKAAERASELALLQYKEGLIDYTPVLNTQQALVFQQDSFATSRGDIVGYLIALYKALGGGWQIRIGKDIIPEQIAETMRNRTDWGDLLQISMPVKVE